MSLDQGSSTGSPSAEKVTPASEFGARELELRHRCFMDGIDWQHHLEADCSGTKLYPDIESLKEGSPCVTTGGCGIVEVEVRLIRWVEPQDLKYPKASAVSDDRSASDASS